MRLPALALLLAAPSAFGLVACGDAAPDPAPPDDRAAVFLDPRGLRLVDSTAGSSDLLAFGAERGGVVRALESAGRPVAPGDTSAECGAGPLASAALDGGLTLWFDNGTFAGWFTDRAGEGAPAYTAPNGLGVGSTFVALEGAYRADVQETTLGTEFYTGAPDVPGGFSGLLDGTEPDATVTALWAGTTCTFR